MSRHANPELELAVIGALLDADGPVLRADTGLLLALTGLSPEDFTDKLCRASLRALASIMERRGPGGALGVWASLRGLKGAPPDGYERLQALQGANTLTRADLQAHASTLKRLAALRRLEEFHRAQLQALEADGAAPEKAARALEDFASALTHVDEPDETGEADVFEVNDSWEAHGRGEHDPLLPTGIEVLDAAITGWERNLNLVGGLPGHGKSALLAACIINQLRAGKRVGLFGLEEGTAWVLKRLLARELRLELKEIGRARLHDYQQERYQHVMGQWHELARNLYVYRRGGITTSQLIARAKRWVVVHGVQVIYVDHGGEVEHEAKGYNGEKHNLAYAVTVRALRNLALNHKVPVVLASHFNRETYDTGRPNLKSFAHTEEVGRMASTAVGMWRRQDGEMLLEVVKQRNGPWPLTLRLAHYLRALVLNEGGEQVDWEAERAREDSERESPRRARAGRGFSRVGS